MDEDLTMDDFLKMGGPEDFLGTAMDMSFSAGVAFANGDFDQVRADLHYRDLAEEIVRSKMK